MPIGFYIYRDFGLLFIRGHGVITQTERVDTILAWLRDPDYQVKVFIDREVAWAWLRPGQPRPEPR